MLITRRHVADIKTSSGALSAYAVSVFPRTAYRCTISESTALTCRAMVANLPVLAFTCFAAAALDPDSSIAALKTSDGDDSLSSASGTASTACWPHLHLRGDVPTTALHGCSQRRPRGPSACPRQHPGQLCLQTAYRFQEAASVTDLRRGAAPNHLHA